MTFRLPLFLLLLLLASACRVGQHYTQPALPVPAQYRAASGPLTTTDTTTLADVAWRSLFQDPALQQLIDSALVHNLDLQVAMRNLESADQLLRQARAAYVPTVAAQVGATSNTASRNSLGGISAEQFVGTRTVKDYNAGLTAAWELDVWGRLRRLQEAARADYLQTTEARKAVQTQLVAQVAQGYYELLRLDAQLAIAHRNTALNDSTLRLLRLQWTAGLVTTLAVDQATAQRQTAALLVPQLEQGIVEQENALRVLTGQAPAAVARAATDAPLAPAGPLAVGVPVALLSRRPDVGARELALVVANARTGAAQASLYPALTLTGTTGLNSFVLSNWLAVPGGVFTGFGVGLAQPLLQRRQLRTQLELARLDQERAALAFRQVVLTAAGEVSSALVRVEKTQQQAILAAARVDTLHQATRHATLLFRSNLASYLEVLTAQGSALQSQLSLVDIRRQQSGAVVELYRALGGGWR
ncbi:MAG TPA: efflux transporter outer membrane subunit [Hymenobacter sp.]|uniref:efflux transporter outer membrane subunit n=1 Tax=Hymenobacter sp. TaxID=1898978 RepID=UPI002D7EE8BB|nr:efflux transporter outer membrane subunit [Hymenobacter sp.]HET9505844.1 efflux transporter outer membrane subunit [Hymenobacter sp.]